jgi:hypothetical protein
VKSKNIVAIVVPAIFIVVENLFIWWLATKSFGFDHPSDDGLDFEDGIRLGILLVCIFVAGLTYAAWNRQWLAFVLQLGIPLWIPMTIGLWNGMMK